MKIAIIGTGAVGGYYGALLSRRGFDVHFLLNSDYEHVRQHGLLVESKNGDMHLPSINAYARPEDMPRCDVAVIGLKTTVNHHLKMILPHALKPDGTVVMLQNGLGVERDAANILPAATVLGGLCFLCSNKIGPGHIRHLDYGTIRLGQYNRDERPAGLTDRLQQIADIFDTAGIAIQLTDDLGKARWEKLVWNMPFNGLSVILNADTRELISSEPAKELLQELMLEVIGGSRFGGHRIEDQFAEQMLTATRKMVAYYPSMKLDYDSGRPLEIDQIYRQPINAAAAAGFHMHKCRMLSLQLEHLDRLNREP